MDSCTAKSALFFFHKHTNYIKKSRAEVGKPSNKPQNKHKPKIGGSKREALSADLSLFNVHKSLNEEDQWPVS
jgi:hypothetical protein